MGVAGLWDIIRPSAEQRSLTHLAVKDGFEANPSGRRGLRVGIDASIWFFHAAYGKEGENPELRTLFFRCARLMSRPFLPLFVFDGPKRPSMKRGKRVTGKEHWLTNGMQRIIEAFGFEWRVAPGEAEAELAFLNRIGVIDAVISDDVDNFLFGATMVIRNPSKTLSGNKGHPVKNAAGKEDDEHVMIYKSSNFVARDDIALTRGGMILIGLLRGGDYHQEGLPGCGPNIAHGLAKCGFGDSLLEATKNLDRDDLEAFLISWRHEVRQELKTNSQRHMKTRKAKLAEALPENFPDIDVLLSYCNPITSETEGRADRISYKWDREPDLGKVAQICELYFEWGVKEVIVKRFRTVIWAPAVLRILRRGALDVDEGKGETAPSTPRKHNSAPKSVGTPSNMITKHFSALPIGEEEESENLIVKIHSKRAHPSTDETPEYRLEISPAQLVRLTEAGIRGLRPPLTGGENFSDEDNNDDDDDDSGKRRVAKPPPDPYSHLRVWMPASMVRVVEPELVEEFEGLQEKKLQKKADTARKREEKAKNKTNSATKHRSTSRAATVSLDTEEEEEEEEEEEDFSDVFGIKKTTTKGKKTVRSSSKAKLPPPDIEETELSADDTPGASSKHISKPPAPTRVNEFFKASKGVPALSSKLEASKPSSSQPRTTLLAQLDSFGESSFTTLPSSSQGGVRPEKPVTASQSKTIPSSSQAPSIRKRKQTETVRTLTRKTTAPSTLESSLPPTSPVHPIPKTPRKANVYNGRVSSTTPDSDELPASITQFLKKSPRKSAEHASPRTPRILGGGGLHDLEEDEDEEEKEEEEKGPVTVKKKSPAKRGDPKGRNIIRPCSPSPMRPVRKAKMSKGLKGPTGSGKSDRSAVIDISSDSEGEDPQDSPPLQERLSTGSSTSSSSAATISGGIRPLDFARSKSRVPVIITTTSSVKALSSSSPSRDTNHAKRREPVEVIEISD